MNALKKNAYNIEHELNQLLSLFCINFKVPAWFNSSQDVLKCVAYNIFFNNDPILGENVSHPRKHQNVFFFPTTECFPYKITSPTNNKRKACVIDQHQ